MENIWAHQMIEVLENRVKNYSEREKENLNYSYFLNLLKHLESNALEFDEELKNNIESLIKNFPAKEDAKKITYSSKLLRDISSLQTAIKKKYNLIPKDYFKKVFLPLGIAFGLPMGLPFGAALDNIALGLPLGMPIGLAFGLIVGFYQDNKAEKENRAL